MKKKYKVLKMRNGFYSQNYLFVSCLNFVLYNDSRMAEVVRTIKIVSETIFARL